MKKKFLSLVLVLAMALTLLPTAALAATPHDSNCQGTLTWSKDENGHSATCDGTDCSGVAQATHNYGNWNSTSGKRTCSDCSYEDTCPHTTKTWGVDSGDATKCKETCSACGYVTTVAQGHVYTKKTGSCDNCSTPHASHEYTDSESSNPGGKCTTCGATCTHPGTAAGAKCSACGVTKAADPTKITSFSASVSPAPATAGGTVSITITANPEAAAADLEVSNVVWTNQSGNQKDETGTATKAPSTSGVYTVAITVKLKSSPTGSWTLPDTTTYAIRDLTVNAASSGTTTPTTPTTPSTDKKDEEKAPTTNAQGVPVASEINTAKQANQAIETLKKTDADVMAERVMTNSAASTSYEAADKAVERAKGISVTVDLDKAAVPSVVRNVDVVGAALNASGSKVALVVDAPSKSYTASSGYQISMTMTGVSNPSKLALPVIITLPLPSDVRAERVVVLHYHGDSAQPDVIIPAVSGSYIRFPVTGFSDFVITDVAASVGNGSTSGAYTTVQGGKNKNSSNNIEDILPAIAAMLSGDGVFVDVQADHWAAKEIRWARDGGVMSGYEGGYFRPTGATTRQQLWMVLARLSGTRPADMAMAREWAINTGVSDGSNPTGALSRQQLVMMLYRYAKSQGVNVSASAKLGSYADGAKVASYAKDAMSWAVGKGIMGGSNGKLNPESVATRAHFAVFLYRYSNI